MDARLCHSNSPSLRQLFKVRSSCHRCAQSELEKCFCNEAAMKLPGPVDMVVYSLVAN